MNPTNLMEFNKEDGRVMYRLTPASLGKDLIVRVLVKYLGQDACGAPNDCYLKTLKSNG